jgi:hypothetical protein
MHIDMALLSFLMLVAVLVLVIITAVHTGAL